MLLLAALVAVLYWPSLVALNAVWVSDRGTYSQGYLIAAVSLWILLMRGRETAARLQPSVGLLPAVLGLAFLWLICARAGIQTAEALLLPLVLWVAIRASFGATVARASVFPCAFLVLAIPVWDPLGAPLQSLITGLPERTIRDRLRRYGVRTRSRGRWNREDRRDVPAETLTELYERQGMTAVEVGKVIGAV